MKVEESLNVILIESTPPTKLSPLVDDDVCEEEAIENNIKVVYTNNIEDEFVEVDEVVNIKESKNHPLEQVIGNLNQRTLRSQVQNQSNFFCFISTIEPKNVNEALGDESWVVAMSSNKTNERRDIFNQSKYIKQMLKKSGLEDSKPTKTPMSTEIKLTKDDKADFMDSTKYRGCHYLIQGCNNVYSPQSSIPQLECAPTTYQQQQSEFSQPDSGLIVPVFQKGDDPIDAINHMMSFLIAVVTSRYPTTNNQLRTSSNPRQQATIYDEKVTVQPVQMRQTTYAAGTMRKYTPGASGSNTGK
ncbi:hypothetical protein Tco_1118110 [Tanacetum coccineum]